MHNVDFWSWATSLQPGEDSGVTPVTVPPILGTGWVRLWISLPDPAWPIHGAGAATSRAWGRLPQWDHAGGKALLLLQRGGWRMKAGCLQGSPLGTVDQGLGRSCGSWIGDHKVLVCLWGELHPLHVALGDLFMSMLQFCCKRGKSKNLRWEPVTAGADGQMCLSYISVLSTTEIIKTAE